MNAPLRSMLRAPLRVPLCLLVLAVTSLPSLAPGAGSATMQRTPTVAGPPQIQGSVCAIGAAARPPARLLFKSGFESGVRLHRPDSRHSEFMLLHGADGTGYRFPIHLWGANPATSGILALIGVDAPEPLTAYINNELVRVSGPDGKPTRALSMRIIKPSAKTCCTQDSFQLPTSVEPVFYQRYQVRLDDGLLQRARQFGRAKGNQHFWRMLWEMKAEPDDYRMRLQLQLGRNDDLFWIIQSDRLTDADPIWIYRRPDLPVPLKRWFLVEVCMDRPAGWFWAAIDGQLIGAHHGDLYGMRRLPTSSVKHAIIYGDPAPGQQWIDNFQIWSGPPCAEPPCGRDVHTSANALPSSRQSGAGQSDDR